MHVLKLWNLGNLFGNWNLHQCLKITLRMLLCTLRGCYDTHWRARNNIFMTINMTITSGVDRFRYKNKLNIINKNWKGEQPSQNLLNLTRLQMISPYVRQGTKKSTLADNTTIKGNPWIPMAFYSYRKLNLLENWGKLSADVTIQSTYQMPHLKLTCASKFTKELAISRARSFPNLLNIVLSHYV